MPPPLDFQEQSPGVRMPSCAHCLRNGTSLQLDAVARNSGIFGFPRGGKIFKVNIQIASDRCLLVESGRNRTI